MKLADLTRSNSLLQQLEDTTVHNWYRFVLSYPDHLVTNLIKRFDIQAAQVVLDPFVGTGTTLVECKKAQISSIGVDANPVAAFASEVKSNWDVDLELFDRYFQTLIASLSGSIQATGNQYPIQMSFDDLLPAGKLLADAPFIENDYEHLHSLLPKNWVSETPLRKCLVIKKILDEWPIGSLTNLYRLALISTFVDCSNLGFGPEVYVSKKRKDADVYGIYVDRLRRMRRDLEIVQQIPSPGNAAIHLGDARKLASFISEPVDYVICSPPYPNEKDYTRITRLELILLGFIQQKDDLKMVKAEMLRSHTRNIYVADNDSRYVADMPEIVTLAQEIETARKERGATSGFERLYHRVVTEYFGGMYRVLEQLQQVVKPGGKLAFVVGDQMSYFRIPIFTARLLNSLACQKLEFCEVETLLWRKRWSSVTKMDVEEHILILERC
jgi:DNA modification methylase